MASINALLLKHLSDTKKTFQTEQGQAALAALILAGSHEKPFSAAFEEYEEYWVRIDPAFRQADRLQADGYDPEKNKNNMDALWKLAIQRNGLEHLNIHEVGIRLRIFSNIQHTQNQVKEYESKMAALSKNIDLFGKALQVTTEVNDKQKDRLGELFSMLTQSQQTTMLGKMTQPGYLKAIVQAVTPEELNKALGFTLNKNVNVSDICWANYNEQAIPNIKEFEQLSTKVKTTTPHKNLLISIFGILPLTTQKAILSRLEQDPSRLNQAFQASSKEDLERYLGVKLKFDLEITENETFKTAIQHQALILDRNITQFIDANIKNIRDKQTHLKFDDQILDLPPLAPNANKKGLEKFHAEIKVQAPKYVAHQIFSPLDDYISFIQGPEDSESDDSNERLNLTDNQRDNLHDAFMLCGSLGDFKKCIAGKVNFEKKMNSHRLGGYIFGDDFKSKQLGYLLNHDIVNLFNDMTETEFNLLKTKAKAAPFEFLKENLFRNERATPSQEYFFDEIDKYLELDHDVIFVPLKAEFEAAQKSIAEFKENFDDLFKANTDKVRLHKEDIEGANDQETARLQKAFIGALEEGKTKLSALKQQAGQLTHYISSLKQEAIAPYKPAQEEAKIAQEQLNKIDTEIRQFGDFLQHYDVQMTRIQKDIDASASSTPKLQDNAAFWETTIRNVDPDYLPLPSTSSSAQAIGTIDNQREDEIDETQSNSRYEPKTKPGEVLEYLVECKQSSSNNQGVFRKTSRAHPQNTDKEQVSVTITTMPDDANAKVTTALRAASEILKTHKQGDPLRLGGKDQEVVAHLYQALIKLGVKDKEITYRKGCSFDPKKHKEFIGYKKNSAMAKAEENFKNNEDTVTASKSKLDHYHSHYRHAHFKVKNLEQRANNIAKKMHKVNNPDEAVEQQDRPNRPS